MHGFVRTRWDAKNYNFVKQAGFIRREDRQVGRHRRGATRQLITRQEAALPGLSLHVDARPAH